MARRASRSSTSARRRRDLAADDPRGWRLGGGVTYAALTTARLGLRTAAVDRRRRRGGATPRELDLLRAAGVDVALVPLAEGPVFHNVETPDGRVQTCLAPGVPLPVVRPAGGWLDARAWSFAPGRRRGRPTLGRAPSRPGPTSPSAWQGFLRDLVAGAPGRGGPRRPVGAPAAGGPGRGQPPRRRSGHDPGRHWPPAATGRRPARDRGRAGGLLVRVGRRRPVDGRCATCRPRPTGDRPDRRRRHVPRRARRARSVRPSSGVADRAGARPAVRGRGRLARRRGAGPGRRPGPRAVSLRRAGRDAPARRRPEPEPRSAHSRAGGRPER